MFRIGEFSQLARVTTKLLRYYDRLGLLTPVRVDEYTGYRYYSAEQLPRLNRIMALKEMGFSLDEIGELIEAEVSAEQMRGMLAVKGSELRHRVEQDRLRLRLIESRINGVEYHEESLDLRAKTLDPMPFLSHRFTCPTIEHALDVGIEIAEVSARIGAPAPPPNLLGIGHGDFRDADVDLEMGVVLRELPAGGPGALADGTQLLSRVLPRAEAITGIRVGLPQLTAQFYSAIGQWLVANDKETAGPARELIMRRPDPARGVEPIVEVQFPIRDRTD